MPRATIASRQLKNKDTGLDLIVPTYKEIKGMVSSTVYYQVVLVSNLACFKTPSHKPSDVVQYSLEKQWSEFEELKLRLSEVFPGTVLPVLNKKSIIVNDMVLRERRNNLDHFVKFLTSVSKMATCAPVLQFLGVDAARAKRFSQGEPLENIPRSTDEEKQEGGNTETNESEVYVFEDDVDDQHDTDLFDEAEENSGDEIIVGAGGNRAAQVSMFEEQDMKWEMTEDDEKDFGFVPDAIITKRVSIDFDESEDNSDLFKIEDDLDKLMTIDVSKKEKQKKEEKLSSPLSPPPPAVKPKAPPKPTPAPKPKPSISNSQAKPASASESRDTTTESSSRVTQANKPKPAPKPRPTNSQAGSSAGSDIKTTSPGKSAVSSNIKDSSNMDKLDQDDILKYLNDNLAADTEEVDLFS